MINTDVCKDSGSAAIKWPESLQGVDARHLREEEVHVWQVELDALCLPAGRETILSNDEQERANRFRFERDRRRFVACRALLRTLLGFYLEVSPAELTFRYTSHGKPNLADEYSTSDIRFNVSHSGSMGLFAFVRHRNIGVDVEQIRKDFQVQELAERFFSCAERQALARISPARRQEAFFHCWARKEAFVKAKGEGLSLPLHQFDVSFLPAEPAELLATRPDCEERNRWTLFRLDTGCDYAAALAVEVPIANVINYRLHSDSMPHALKSKSEPSAEPRMFQRPNYA